jgi:RimJ/RimL family protein N-acetyltransferase
MIELHASKYEDAPLFAEMELAEDTAEFVFGWNRQAHESEMRKERIIYLSIDSEKDLSGFFILALEPDGETVEFRRIVVSKKGKVIGQSAIAKMEDHYRNELGRSKIWLDVLETNSRGKHIYQKLGYKEFKTGEQEGRRLLFKKKEL